MKFYRPLFPAFVSLLVACTALPPTYPWEPDAQYSNAGYAPPGAEVGAAGRRGFAGRDFCRDLANRAQKRAGEWTSGAWLLTVGAALATGAGAISIATNSDDPSDLGLGLNVALPLLATLFSTGAVALFDRERDTDALASAASSAVNAEEDKAAARACNEGIADWNAARANIAERSIKQLDAEVKSERADPLKQPATPPQASASPPTAPQ